MVNAGRGVIINLASVSGFRVSGDGRVHYAASKGAVRSLTQAFAREFSPHGVRVVALAPTATRTEGVLEASEALSAAAGSTEYENVLPMRRMAEPDDIARVALFAASDLAGMITGTTIAVDGGQMAV
jgi:NAD(P)-dependent dehydrogenase (short-subunit alcohol dehydrogenase family)